MFDLKLKREGTLLDLKLTISTREKILQVACYRGVLK